jgi:hypothetical protein
MKFGPGELALVIIIAMVVLLVVRLVRMAHSPSAGADVATGNEENNSSGMSPRTRVLIFGSLVVLAGILIFFSSLSLIRWVFWGPVGAVIAILAGISIIVLARRR